MALQPNQLPKPVVKSRITHRTATLKGQHNQSKALYRLGVTADEIHRDKALKTLGGTEDTFKQTLTLWSHAPSFKSSAMLSMQTQDPLEAEYTQHSETADTINQSAFKRKDSSSFSVTWTHSHHSHNRSDQLQKSRGSSSWRTDRSNRSSGTITDTHSDPELKRYSNSLGASNSNILALIRSFPAEPDPLYDSKNGLVLDHFMSDIVEENELDLEDQSDVSPHLSLTGSENEANPPPPRPRRMKRVRSRSVTENEREVLPHRRDQTLRLFQKRKSDSSCYIHNRGALIPRNIGRQYTSHRHSRQFSSTPPRRTSKSVTPMSIHPGHITPMSSCNTNHSSDHDTDTEHEASPMAKFAVRTPKEEETVAESDDHCDSEHGGHGTEEVPAGSVRVTAPNKYQSRRSSQRFGHYSPHSLYHHGHHAMHHNTRSPRPRISLSNKPAKSPRPSQFLFNSGNDQIPQRVPLGDTMDINGDCVDHVDQMDAVKAQLKSLKIDPHLHPNKVPFPPAAVDWKEPPPSRHRRRHEVGGEGIDRRRQKVPKLLKKPSKWRADKSVSKAMAREDTPEAMPLGARSMNGVKDGRPALSKLSKEEERMRWKLSREMSRNQSSLTETIKSGNKIRKFFGDDPQNQKLKWKMGESVDEMMKIRSLDIVQIAERDDTIRKAERRQFSRRAKLINKLSRIKSRFSKKAPVESEERFYRRAHSMDTSYSAEPRPMALHRQPRQRIPSSDSISETLSSDQFPNSNVQMKRTKMFVPNLSATPYVRGHAHHCSVDHTADSASHFTGRGSKGASRRRAGNRMNANSNTKSGGSRKINFMELNRQSAGLSKLLSQFVEFSDKDVLGHIIAIYHRQYMFSVQFIVYLMTTIDEACPEYVYLVAPHVDTPNTILDGWSLWQYLLRHQLPHIDIQRFFYSFGPLIGKYKTLRSPLHLCAQKLIECSRGKESHITTTTSPPDCVYALDIFKWLLFMGYDLEDGEMDNAITPQTILHHSPRILKQILSYKRQFLHKQRETMQTVDSVAFKAYQLLLDDDILTVIEKFTFSKFRKRHRVLYGHQRFQGATVPMR